MKNSETINEQKRATKFCCDECDWVLNHEDDGQPDEMQEWHDFDPLC